MIPPVNRNNPAFAVSANAGGNNSAIKISVMDLTEDNAVIFPHVSAIDITTGDYAISFWIQMPIMPDTGSNIIPWQKTSAGGANADDSYLNMLGTAPGVIDTCDYSVTETGPASISDITDPSSYDFSDWVNVVLRKDSSGISTWFNGTQLGSGATVASPLLSDPTSFYALFYEPVNTPDPLLVCDVRLADFRFYNGSISPSDIADLAAKLDVTTNLSTRVQFKNNCDDSVGAMNGTKGANVQYCPGPPGLPE